MQRQQNRAGQGARTPWMRWLGAGLGMAVIAGLLYALLAITQSHMERAKEVSRNTRWQVHAPVAGAQAAALLQGEQP